MTLDEAIEFGMPCVNLAQDAEWCEFALEIMKKYQKLISDISRKMREAAPEERESINKYIKSISKPTGVDFWDLEQGSVLDKIRADIEEYKSRQLTLAIGTADLELGKQIALEYVLRILDEYKTESEVEE